MTFLRRASLAASAVRAASAFALLQHHPPADPVGLRRHPSEAGISSSLPEAGISSSSSLSLSLSSRSSSSPSAPPPLAPAVSLLRERFQPGDFYVWLYRDELGNPTSWEKYTVAENPNPDDDGAVIIEMSTKFSEGEEYTTHHRLTVDLARHLGSFRNRGAWRIGFEYFAPAVHVGGGDGDGDGGGWTTFGAGDNVQAFEEKFDAFTMLGDAATTATVSAICGTGARKCRQRKVHVGLGLLGPNGEDVDRGDAVALVRTARHDYTGAWYWRAPRERHRLSGVAIFKEFSEHSFSLIEVGSGGGVERTNVRVQL